MSERYILAVTAFAARLLDLFHRWVSATLTAVSEERSDVMSDDLSDAADDDDAAGD